MTPMFKKIWGSPLFKAALAAAAILVFLSPAMAQVPGTTPLTVDQLNAATQSGDLSKSIWRFIFGDFADNPFSALGGPTTLLGSMFVIFNVGIFSIGMISLSYGVGSGIIGTANDGQALGQRINSAWYPIRVVVGVGGLIPIFSGFTGSQALIMWLGSLAIGLANLMWSGAINPQGDGSQQLINMGDPSVTAPVAAKKAATDLFVSEVCVIYYQHAQDRATAEGIPYAAPETMLTPKINSASRSDPGVSNSSVEIAFGTNADPALCGNLRLTQADGNNLFGTTTRGSSSFTGAFRNNSVDYAAISAGVLDGYKSAIVQLYSDTNDQALKWVKLREDNIASGNAANPDFPSADIDIAVQKYQTSITNAASKAASGKTNGVDKAVRENMLQWGWLSAGAWYSTFSEINTAIAEAVKGTRIVVDGPTDISIVPNDVKQGVVAAATSVATYTKTSAPEANGDAGAISNALKETGCLGGLINQTATGNCSFGQMIISKAINFSVNGFSRASTNVMIAGVPLISPIIMFKNIGDYLMTFSSTIILTPGAETAMNVGGKIASGIGTALSVIPGGAAVGLPLKAAGATATWLASSAYIILGLGALMSLYIPMIPFIVWMGGVIGYCASFLEGLVAMPLHSFSHLDTDGEGMGQKTAHGYLFMLNTIARPALMVIAFFIASGLVTLLGTFQAAMLLPAIANAQGNSITGLFSIIGFLIIFFVLNVVLINSCFELIHVLPDQVIGFVGSGNISTHLGRETEGKINGMFALAVKSGKDHISGVDGGKKPKPSSPGTPGAAGTGAG